MALSERDRKVLIIGGAVVGGLLVLFLLFNLFSGGGNEAAPPLTFSPGTSPSVTTSPALTPSPVVSFGGRDPFSIPPALAPTTSTTSTSTSTSTSQSASQTQSPSSSPTAPSGSSTTIDGKTVVLLDTFTKNGVEKAQVEVNGKVYNGLEVGDTFDHTFEVRSISGQCASFLFGDQSFSLCTNPQK